MILPIREDELTVGRLPWATFALMLAFSAMFVLGSTVDRDWAASGMVPAAWSWQTHTSHLLLHATWAHWLGSMLLLLAAGAALEVRWGRLPYLAFLVVSALLTAGAYQLVNPESSRPLVGPSGALAAALAAVVFEYRRSGIQYTWIAWYKERLSGSFWVPAYALAGLWFGCEVLMQVESRPDGLTRGVTHWAQLAGFALGAGGAWLIARAGIGDAGRDGDSGIRDTIRAALMARESGDPLLAFIQLERAAREHPGHPELLEALWESACDCDRADQAAPLLMLHVQHQLAIGEQEPAARRWCEIDAAVPDLHTDPGVLLQLAPLLSGMGRRREAARALRSALGDERRVSPGLALRIAELARDVHAATALCAAQRALEAPDLHEAKRTRVEALVAELQSRDPSKDLELDPVAVKTDRSIAIEMEDPLAPPPGIPRAPETDVAEGPRAFELSADGSLESSGARFELSDDESVDPAELTPVIPAAEPPARPPAGDAPPDPQTTPDRTRVPPPGPDGSTIADVGPEIAAQETRFHAHKVLEAVPLEFGPERLELAQVGGKRGHVDYRRIDAVSAGAVRGLADKPVIVIDLVLNWTELESSHLRVIRLRSDTFDATPFAPGAARPLDAFRKIAEMLLGRSRGVALPDSESAQGRPFRIYEDLATYHRDVLLLSD